uniref:Uncharacterized protein n=1 Tax=Candidatus Kentrum sp. FW TaxID=2126338 RepID=A0A450S679_9GAMM|nr:MAG: hypothetical protein BECKFW1821A_GA0114235_101615 [Candidatus Kentron sp. FW]
MQAQLAQLRALLPELKGASDEQLMNSFRRLCEKKHDNKPPPLPPPDEATLDRMSADKLSTLGEQLLNRGQ